MSFDMGIFILKFPSRGMSMVNDMFFIVSYHKFTIYLEYVSDIQGLKIYILLKNNGPLEMYLNNKSQNIKSILETEVEKW